MGEIRSYVVMAGRDDTEAERDLRQRLVRAARRYSSALGARVGTRVFCSNGRPPRFEGVDRPKLYLARADVLIAEISAYDPEVWEAVGTAAKSGKAVLCLSAVGAGNGERAAAVAMLKAAHPKIRFRDYMSEAEIEEVVRRYFLNDLPRLVA